MDLDYSLYALNLFPAVFLAFGVLKYDLLDIGVLIRKGTAYFILTAVITLIYVALIALFNAFFWEFGQKHSLVLPVTLALLMTLIFDPLRKKVQAFIDQIKHFLVESITTALRVTHVSMLYL